MLDVYCISGMGVDGRMFRNIRLENCRIHHVRWTTPHPRAKLGDYAMSLTDQIDSSKPFVLIGVSFGGMCAVEIAKRLDPAKVFIISSCKKSSEVAPRIRIWKILPVHRFLGDAIFIKGAMLVKRQFGVRTREQTEKFREMLKSSPRNYFRRAVNCVLTWKNSEVPSSVIQIHGDKDEILPIRNIRNCDHVIKGGTHFMVMDRADEINDIINRELRKLQAVS